MIKLFINAAAQTNPRKSANTPGKKKKRFQVRILWVRLS